MKKLIVLAALPMLAACGQGATEPVGKYIIYHDPGIVGSIRLNTVTGEARMLVPTDTPPLTPNGATFDGKPLVWTPIRSG